MLVDDDHTMVKLLRTLLELDGFEVVQVARGRAVLEAVRNESPDVVLMDVHLADADGTEILRSLRADPQLGGQKVIMTSGLDMRAQCDDLGADAFIQKPYPPDKLSATIRTLLNQ